MSNSTRRPPWSIDEPLDAQTIGRLLFAPIKRLAFWAAVVLPVLHLSLLTTGLDSSSTVMAFALLVTLNVLALVVGHPHRH